MYLTQVGFKDLSVTKLLLKSKNERSMVSMVRIPWRIINENT